MTLLKELCASSKSSCIFKIHVIGPKILKLDVFGQFKTCLIGLCAITTSFIAQRDSII